MINQIKTAVLGCLLVLMSVAVNAQTCNSNIPASTPTNSFTDNHDGTVTDNQTDLMWKRCSEGQSWNVVSGGCDGDAAVYNWQNAFQQATTANTSYYASHNDWRVPNIKELASIIEVQCYNASINLEVFPNTVPVYSWAAFWSSSVSYEANATSSAWNVSFVPGIISNGSRGQSLRVRLVRDAG